MQTWLTPAHIKVHRTNVSLCVTYRHLLQEILGLHQNQLQHQNEVTQQTDRMNIRFMTIS